MPETTNVTTPATQSEPPPDPWGMSLPAISHKAVRQVLALLNERVGALLPGEPLHLDEADVRRVTDLLLRADQAALTCRMHLQRLDADLSALSFAVCCVDEDSVTQLRDAVDEAEAAHASAESELACIELLDLMKENADLLVGKGAADD